MGKSVLRQMMRTDLENAFRLQATLGVKIIVCVVVISTCCRPLSKGVKAGS